MRWRPDVVRDVIEAGLNWPADTGTALWVQCCDVCSWRAGIDGARRCDTADGAVRRHPALALRGTPRS